MAEPEYRQIMTLFYSQVAGFMSQRREIFEELIYEEAFLKDLDMSDEDRRNIILDWYIFDHKSEILKKNFLEYFLEKADIDKEAKDLYSGFRDTIYSVFEVKAIRTGKEMMAYNLLDGKDYNIKDTTLIQHITKGQLVIMRVLKYMDYNILTGKAYAFPLKASQSLKLSLLNAKDAKKPSKLTPLMICKIFHKQEKPEKLPPLERFRLLCKECNLEDSYIDEIIQKTKEKVENKGHFNDIQKKYMAKLKPHAHFDMKELIDAYMDVWNGFIKGHVKKGPIEEALLNASFAYIQQKINPRRFKDNERASLKAEKVFEEWLNAQHDELGGKTPKELILKEREDLGNPEKRIKFRIEITNLAPGEEVMRKAQDAVNKAIQLLNDNKPKEAIEVYREHLSAVPRNHVAWQNMGLAYILCRDKENAERCFKKALEIDPNYKVAKDNLRILEAATQEDIKGMADEFRVKIVNRGKSRALNIEDMYEDMI
ncbi:tetratricopeptide repeat protein [Candidatus Omnitrophota bacterium]